MHEVFSRRTAAEWVHVLDAAGVPCAVVQDLASLPDDPQRYPVAGKVAWITPARAAGSRAPGVGVRFPADEKSRQLKARIEEALGGSMASDRPTQTI